MELWIRSQDKTRLVKITQVKFVDKESDLDDFKNVIRGYGVDGFNFRLGTYETKERAIEVLDEIQNKLNIRHCNDAGIQFILINEMTPIIYQMPEK